MTDVTTTGPAAGAAPAVGAPKAGPTYFSGTGRRTTAIARVRLRKGEGIFQVNTRDLDEYFVRDQDRQEVLGPLRSAKALGRYDVFCNVRGGGFSGQAGAVVMGIARALLVAEAELEGALRAEGFLTRDARMKERKKYGQKGARKRFQFSKR